MIVDDLSSALRKYIVVLGVMQTRDYFGASGEYFKVQTLFL